LRDERRKERQYTQVPNLRGVYARNARRALRQKQRQQHAHGSRGAIGRDEYRSDVEENWMHLSQNTAFSLQA
jgi:hypothetical protein